MKVSITIFALMSCALMAFGQSNNPSTPTGKFIKIKSQINTVTSDTLKAELLVQLAEAFMYTNMDSTLYYCEKALEIAEKNDILRVQLGAMGFKTQALINLGNLPKALEISVKAIELGSGIEGWIGDLGPNYDNRQQIYFLIGNYDRALEFSRKEATITSDPMSVAFGNWNMAVIFENLNQLDSALFYLDKSFESFGKIEYSWYPDPYHVYPHWYNTRAKIYGKQGKTMAALQDLHQSLRMSTNNDEPVLSAITSNDLADLFFNMEQLDSSIFYAELALRLSQKSNFIKGKLDAATLLAKLYESVNPVQSLQYYKLKEEQQNSLFGSGNMDAIRQMIVQDEKRQAEIEASKKAFENKIKQNILLDGLGTILLITLLLYRNNKQKQKANKVLEKTLNELKSTQAQLVQKEKLASLGELTAGIAHEIQNPLNFVNNFSDVNKELAVELEQEIDKGNYTDAKAIVKDIKDNEEKINQHGKHADGIVKSMLLHTQKSSGQKELTDINALCDEYLRLAYHGLKAKDKSFNAKFETDFYSPLPKVNVVPQDIGRVMLNLLNNAFYAVNDRSRTGEAGYQPSVSVTTKLMANSQVQIVVRDNGNGIPDSIKEKIFQPFFTTKPTGQGTGLGLSLAYDIISKGHDGKIVVASEEGKGSTFTIELPL